MVTASAVGPAHESRYADGLTRLRAGQNAAAIGLLREVLTGDPSHAGARRNLIRALSGSNDHVAVIEETTRALLDAPESAELHFLRGTAFNALCNPTCAKEALLTAVTLNPAFAPAWLNLGNACMDLDDLETAETHCRRALTLDPALIEASISLGFILTSAGRPAAAIAVLEDVIRAHPKNVHAHWNLAAALLLSGDMRRGFQEYEWRKRHDRYRRDFIDLPGPVWDGGDLLGRKILVHAEQGLGDTIQFARYLPQIAERGGAPILACEPSLIPLLSRIVAARIVSKFEALPPYDAWVDQMSLPNLFGSTSETIPGAAGYLAADQGLIDAHRATLPSASRIGLAWAGNPLHRNDRRRTPPAEVFQTLADHSPISLVPDRALPGIPCPTRRLSDYGETAALIAALDLVITVDTSVAHVAGALGRPAWVLLPYAPDWRWGLKRNDTPWYDSIRLFRQPSPGDWASVMTEVVAALAG